MEAVSRTMGVMVARVEAAATPVHKPQVQETLHPHLPLKGMTAGGELLPVEAAVV
jgi:hypothetical protein